MTWWVYILQGLIIRLDALLMQRIALVLVKYTIGLINLMSIRRLIGVSTRCPIHVFPFLVKNKNILFLKYYNGE